jgi:hypothetical protein
MACFVAPATVAIVTTVVQKVVEKREKKALGLSDVGAQSVRVQSIRAEWARRLRWLNTMLWGGTALLALEHLWHGELTASPPFLTALQTPGQVGPVLREIALYGGGMVAAVFVAWGLVVAVAEYRARARRRAEAAPAAGGTV